MRRAWVVVLLTVSGSVLIVLLVLAYFEAPTHFAPDLAESELATIPSEPERLAAREDRLVTQNSIRGTSLQMVGGIVVLGGAIAAWYQVQLRRADQKIAREDQRMTREQQITERFTRAIDQLGNSESLDVRLGGIHALVRIARDSHDDRPALVAVLAAFLRRTARKKLGESDERLSLSNRSVCDGVQRQLSEDSLGARVALEQILVLVTDAGQSIPVDLSGVDLTSSKLAGVDLRDADLSGADLTKADLRGADLTRANLNNARLTEARLHDALLVGARLDDAVLEGARASDANFIEASLVNSRIDRAGLVRANFTLADLTNASLKYARLGSAVLTRATLVSVRFDGGDLTSANLKGANLKKAVLRGANLTKAKVGGARGLTEAQLSNAYRRPSADT